MVGALASRLEKSGIEAGRTLGGYQSLDGCMVAVAGRPWQVEASEGTGRARLCAYIKLWTLKSPIGKEWCDRGQGQHNKFGLLDGITFSIMVGLFIRSY